MIAQLVESQAEARCVRSGFPMKTDDGSIAQRHLVFLALVPRGRA